MPNANSRQELDKQSYFDLRLISINRKSLRDLDDRTNSLISTIQLAPSSYRLDCNAAGSPISYRSKAGTVRDVVAGTTAEIPVPLIPADAIARIVKNITGKPSINY